MRLSNPEAIHRFVDELQGRPDCTEVRAALEGWVSAVTEADCRSFGALGDAFPEALVTMLSFNLGNRYALKAQFNFASNSIVIKFIGRLI